MLKNQHNVLEMMIEFGQDVRSIPTADIPEGQKKLRRKLIKEEVEELFDAMDRNDIVKIIDALADIDYVVNGTALAYGIDLEPYLNEVHRSNMSKKNPDGSITKNEYGKIVKPPTYSPADISGLLALDMAGKMRKSCDSQ